MKKLICEMFIFSILIAFFFSVVKGGQEPLAYIQKFEGKVEVYRPDSKKAIEVKSVFELFQGDSLVVHPDAIVEICYLSGAQQTLIGYKSLVFSKDKALGGDRKQKAPMFKEIIDRLKNSSVAVQRHVGATRSVDEEFFVIVPRKSYMLYKPFRFHWQKLNKETRYKFQIAKDRYFEMPVYSKIVTDTTIVIYPDSLNLLRDKRYYWKVQPQENYSGIWDSSFFQIYSEKDQKTFLDGKKIVTDAYETHPGIPLVVYYDMRTLYADEYELLLKLIKEKKNQDIYYKLMVNLLDKTGVLNLAHQYSVKVLSFEK